VARGAWTSFNKSEDFDHGVKYSGIHAFIPEKLSSGEERRRTWREFVRASHHWVNMIVLCNTKNNTIIPIIWKH